MEGPSLITGSFLSVSGLTTIRANGITGWTSAWATGPDGFDRTVEWTEVSTGRGCITGGGWFGLFQAAVAFG